MTRWISLVRLALAGVLFLVVAALIYVLATPQRADTPERLLVTFAAAALALSCLWVDLTAIGGRVDASGPFRRLGCFGVGATAAALGISLLLIWWTLPLRTSGVSWRLWWISSTLAVHSAHVLLLFRTRPVRWVALVRNATVGAAVAFALLMVGLAFRRDVFAMPGSPLRECLYATGAAGAAGSLVLLLFGRPAPVRLPWTAIRLARWVAFPVALFSAGYYFGRVTAPPPPVFDTASGFSADFSRESLESQVRADLARLHAVAEAIEKTRGRADALRLRLEARRRDGEAAVFPPEEDDEIRSLFFSYLSCRTVLLRMVAFYQGFDALRDEQLKARCFLIGAAAGSICYSQSLTLVGTYRDDPMCRAKLNEPEPACGIPTGMFDRIYESVALQRHFEAFEEMTAYFEVHRDRWRQCGLPPEEAAWILNVLEGSVSTVKASPLYGKSLPVSILLSRVKADAYRPVYAIQSLVSTWIGDTRLVRRRPCISDEQLGELRRKLRPGDIILERRNWFLSNAFLPGFWPHAALYVGTLEDLKRLGIDSEPAVRDRLAQFTAPARDGEPRCVIESISEGVSFSSLGEAARADYIAVLRPRASDAAVARAILRAFTHQGKPYDFEFDFFSADKLVCTELVYRAYEGQVHFPLVKIMGRMTLPAVEIARKFARERSAADHELDFILFLDAQAGGESAAFTSDEEFCASAERPRAFNE